MLSNTTEENLLRVCFRVTTRAVPLGLCKGGVVGYFHDALKSKIRCGVVQRTTIDEVQIIVEGDRNTIEAVHQELKSMKTSHFQRDPKMLWSLETKVVDPNCLRPSFTSFTIIRDPSVPPGASSPPHRVSIPILVRNAVKFMTSIN